jgi:hypothetical protein
MTEKDCPNCGAPLSLLPETWKRLEDAAKAPYPFVRLKLACGCKEVATGPGAAAGWNCQMHEELARREAHAGRRPCDPEDAMSALYEARRAIDTHSIVTVGNGGGVARLDNDRRAKV